MIYHLTCNRLCRTHGRNAVQMAAYITRNRYRDEKTGTLYDHRRLKGGEIYLAGGTILCENAPEEWEEPEKLWNAVEQSEKQTNAQVARVYEFSLSNEWDDDTMRDVAEEFVRSAFVKRGMCATYGIHKKEGNFHVHVITTIRPVTNEGTFGAKSKKVYDLDGNGERIFLKKDRSGRKVYKNHREDTTDWEKKETLKAIRKEWADTANRYLPDDEKISEKSFRERNIHQIPTVHEGYTARKMEAEGTVSDKCDLNREIREMNEQVLQAEQEAVLENGILSELTEERDRRRKESERRLKGLSAGDAGRDTDRSTGIPYGLPGEDGEGRRGDEEENAGTVGRKQESFDGAGETEDGIRQFYQNQVRKR